MTFSTRILLVVGAGVALGLFLGEYRVALKWAATGFVKQLQMTVRRHRPQHVAADARGQLRQPWRDGVDRLNQFLGRRLLQRASGVPGPARV
jgi:hypothetical protein